MVENGTVNYDTKPVSVDVKRENNQSVNQLINQSTCNFKEFMSPAKNCLLKWSIILKIVVL